jgi:hypothetical protein
MPVPPADSLTQNSLREAAPAGRAARGQVENSRRKLTLIPFEASTLYYEAGGVGNVARPGRRADLIAHN